MTEPRMPIEEARRLWRSQQKMAVTDTEPLRDPFTGEPTLDVTREFPVIWTPATLGYTLDELDPDTDDDD